MFKRFAHHGPVDRIDLTPRPPRFTSPPGVTLRRLGETETTDRPVLVCGPCRAPTLHLRHGDVSVCLECKTERRW